MLFIILLLILNVLINFKKVDRKINDITKYKEDIVFLEDRYNNILKIDGDNDKLNNSNNDYNNKIGNIKKEIENINVKINKLKGNK